MIVRQRWQRFDVRGFKIMLGMREEWASSAAIERDRYVLYAGCPGVVSSQAVIVAGRFPYDRASRGVGDFRATLQFICLLHISLAHAQSPLRS